MFTVNGKAQSLGFIGGVIAVFVLFGMLLSLPVMLLWNSCLVGAIDGVHEITWLQAWGLQVLVNIIFRLSLSTKD
jgi:hypothetical protein